MIAARSPVVKVPPGKYKLADVLYRVMKLYQKGYKKGNSRYRKPPKRIRPHQPYKIGNRMKGKLWIDEREHIDPDGMMELWSR